MIKNSENNLIGQTFGLWTVIDEAESYKSPTTGEVICKCWLCRCICGTERIIRAAQLRYRKNNYGCGCKGINQRIRKNKVLNCMEYVDRQGRIILFDECDLDIMKLGLWNVNSSSGYASSNKYGLLHRKIMNVSNPKDQIDHINGNRSDNRRCNLRIVDNQHNCWNSTISSNNTSGHKNVVFDKQRNMWRIRISKDGKEYTWHSKEFDEACRIAEEKHKQLFGEYSFYNSRKENYVSK